MVNYPKLLEKQEATSGPSPATYEYEREAAYSAKAAGSSFLDSKLSIL
jgi:hypothetical protein